MPRTTAKYVQDILQDNYGPRADDTLPDLTRFIKAANLVVTKCASLAPDMLMSHTHTSAELIEIETWLAAHFYLVNDPLYTSRSTGGQSGSFQRGGAGEGFELTEYGKQACRLDMSGALMALSRRAIAGAEWLGTIVDDQKGIEDR